MARILFGLEPRVTCSIRAWLVKKFMRRIHVMSLLVSILGCVAVLRYLQPIPDEDAYISFVYSKSLVSGLGLTYHGAQVEGFTNPLTVFLVGLLAWTFNGDPATVGFSVSILFTVLSLVIILELARNSSDDWFWKVAISIVITLLFFLNPCIFQWGFSGMESSLYAFLWLVAVLLIAKERLVASAIVLSLIPIVRSDAAPLLIVPLFFWQQKLKARVPALPRQALFIGAIAVPSVVYLLFRWHYFHELVPNTAYKKFLNREIGERLNEGAVYVVNYFIFSLLPVTFLFSYLAARTSLPKERLPLIRNFGLCILAQLALIVFAGGDVSWKPYFRFCYPVEIMSMAAIVLLINHVPPLRRISLCLVLLLLRGFIFPDGDVLSNGSYAQKFYSGLTVDSVVSRIDYRRDQPRDWSKLLVPGDDVLSAAGRVLSNYTAANKPMLITTAAGKLVYYSELGALDLTGLADDTWRKNPHRNFDRFGANIVLAFEHHFGRPWIFADPASTGHKPLAAVVYSATRYGGMPVLIFSDCSSCLPSEVVGDTLYRAAPVNIAGRQFLLYADSMESRNAFVSTATAEKYFE